MSNCVNFRNKEVIEIANKLGISPYMTAAKIGVWQDKNGIDKWPTFEDLSFGLKGNNLTSRLFKDSNVVTSKEALEFIANENTIFSSLAEKLLKYDKVNPVAITYKKDSTFIPSKDKDGNDIKASGVYYPFDNGSEKENEIEIANHGERREAEIILHEILHAYTYNAVRSNGAIANKLFDLLEHANKHLNSKIKKGSKEEYGLSNIDEFMVAVFTSNELVKALKEVPAHPSYKGNNFLDSFAKFILSVFNFKKTNNEFYLQAFNVVKELLDQEVIKETSRKDFEAYKATFDSSNSNEPLYLPNGTNTPLASPNENVKPGVEELFNSNPELAEIGTPEQYSKYLDQIFPNSVVKEIVYHGGDVEVFEEREEWSYFTKDKEYASNYGKVKAFKINILKGARLNTISKTEIAETYKEELKDFDGVIGEEAFGIVKKGDNSFIAKGEALVVRNPNQIHILGNKQDIKGFKDFVNKEDTILTANNKSNEVNYQLKAVNILISDKAKQVFEKGNKANWSLDKILTELQIPKGQKDIILGLGKNDREEIITDLLANYSYTIEVNVATTKEKNHLVSKIENDDYEYSYQDDEDFNRIIYENNLDTNLPYEELKQQVLNILYQKLGKEKNTPTQHYSNLTVPGGTNYTERNFETPLIKVPKSHAQFNTENTIGFTRGDDRVVYTENDIESLLATMQNSGILKIKCD